MALGRHSCAPVSGTTFALGNTPVTCNATDAAGNAATATTFVVHVVDTTPPVVTPPTNQTLEATGPSGVTATFSATATDSVGRRAGCVLHADLRQHVPAGGDDGAVLGH